MSKNELTAIIAAILSSLHEADNGTPESTLYILCGMDMDKWNTVRGIMLRAGWITCKSHFVNITNEGRNMAIKVNEVMNVSK